MTNLLISYPTRKHKLLQDIHSLQLPQITFLLFFFWHTNVLIQLPFQVPAKTEQNEHYIFKNLGLYTPNDFKITAIPGYPNITCSQIPRITFTKYSPPRKNMLNMKFKDKQMQKRTYSSKYTERKISYTSHIQKREYQNSSKLVKTRKTQ